MAIVQSLLDLDYYKLTMGQLARRHHADVPVTFAFANRTASVRLPELVPEDELRAELERVRSLRFRDEELAFLRESAQVPRGLFSEAYLSFLARLRLPEVDLGVEDASFRIEASGRWPEVTLWETLILSVLTELYARAALERQGRPRAEALTEGRRRLAAKIERLRGEPRARFSDFGTRRRFSFDWQREVVETLARELPEQFIGTSNVLLAKELGLRPIGTFAHELEMVLSGIYHNADDEIRASHQRVLRLWWDVYGEPLSIALADTYGSDFFFRDFRPEQARLWRGLRHDSGDPFEFGERAVAYYRGLGVDPREKQIVFSDGLEVETIVRLVERFDGRIQVLFGWGTNLTNDLGVAPLSLVVKAIRSCGHATVKLGDNLDKAIGAPEEIERFVRIFGYKRPPPRLGVKY